MEKLLEGWLEILGEDRVGHFIKDHQHRYVHMTDAVAKYADATAVELMGRGTLTDHIAPWRAAADKMCTEDLKVLEGGWSRTDCLTLRPESRVWNRTQAIKGLGKDGQIHGIVIDITDQLTTRPSPLIREGYDWHGQCVWLDRDRRRRLSRRDLLVLGYHLDGFSHKQVAAALRMTPKAVEKVVARIREHLTDLCCAGESYSLQRCCVDLGITHLLWIKRDWFDGNAVLIENDLNGGLLPVAN